MSDSKPEKRVRLSPFERPEMRLEDKERVLNAFTEAFLNREMQTRLGAGTTAEVCAYLTDPALQKFVSKFAYADRPHEGVLNDLETEFDMQLRAWQMVNGWAEKYPKAPRVHVPEPIGYARKEDKEAIVMERVPGKTLWRLLMENYLRTEGVASGHVSERDIEDLTTHPDDALIEDVLIKRTPMANLYQQGRHKDIEKTLWDNCFRKQSAIVSEEQFKAIQTFAVLAKREKFWHRDFHSKNVMLADDGRTFVIDFGLTTADMEEKDAMSIERVGEDVMLTAGYDGLIAQLRGSGNGESNSAQPRAKMASWRTLDKR